MTPTPTPIAASVRERFAPYFEDPERAGLFHNPWPHPELPSMRDLWRWKTQANPLKPSGYRARAVPAPRDAYAAFAAQPASTTRLFWIGHASFLMELDGARFVVDPIFGRAGGLSARVTPAAVTPEQLTGLSAVLVTHGHHDHCDPQALRALAEANQGRAVFVVPRGLGKVLPRVCEPRIELSWWQYVTISGVRVHLVPAQHWHRRGLFDLNRALWGGYVLEGSHRVFHSGDTGYFGGFHAIGAAFAGIDAACLPLGAYEPRWFMGSQHMSPEESLAAHRDLSATHFVGMHWGAYDLSNEPVEAGPVLFQQAAREQGLDAGRLHVPRPGGSIALEGARGATTARASHTYSAESATVSEPELEAHGSA